MTPTLTIIETYEDDRVEWGVSTAGYNPPPEEYIEVASKEEAFEIKAAYDRGDIMPLLDAAMRGIR